MKLLSENGWNVLTTAPPVMEVAGVGLKIRVKPGDVATVFDEFIRRFHHEVERLDLPGLKDEWGWYCRPVRGSSSVMSDHASATAIDLNATRHPRGQRGTFTAAQVKRIRRILADLGGVIQWGGDFHTTVDEMHFRIHASSAEVKAVAIKIIAGRAKPKPVPPIPPVGENAMRIVNVAGPDKRYFLLLDDATKVLVDAADVGKFTNLGVPNKGDADPSFLDKYFPTRKAF